MDDTELEGLTLAEKISIVMDDLPDPVQKFLKGPERDAVSLKLSQKYALHTDQAGAFERAYLYMLLGIDTPADFVQDLQTAGIPEETVRGLARDINEEVFKKLHDEELSSDDTKPAPGTAPARVEVPVMRVGEPVAPAAPSQTTAYDVPHVPHLVNLISTPPAQSVATPIQPIAPAPVSVPAPVPIVSMPTPAQVASEFRTMASDIEALQGSMPAIPNPAHVSPARSFQTASVPYTSVPTASQPAIQQHDTASASGMLGGVNYSSDPYREPLE